MTGRVVALSGGIGGAKLALGLYRALPPDTLTVICNTGDDFEHLGVTICPDIDTVTYTLSGLSNRTLGWGREDESWAFMETLATLGGETWFRLGDRDMALHVARTQRLAAGEGLSAITSDMARRLGIDADIRPMSDTPVRTIVQTPDGTLAFQRYFVEQQCGPTVTGFAFDGADSAVPAPGVLDQILAPETRCIVICPSNPFISIDPILAVPGIKDGLAAAQAPVVAVSPIIGGASIKGPTAKMMTELGFEISNATIAKHYDGVLDGLVIDAADTADAQGLKPRTLIVPTLMTTDADKDTLATSVLTFADALRSEM